MVELKNVTKTYRSQANQSVKALDNVSIKFEEKGMVFILGKSGSGKSTLLNVLGGLDRYDDGEIIIKGKSSKNFTQIEFDSYRNTYLGFIFQEYNLLPEFTIGANIALAMELQGKKSTDAALNEILREVDIAELASRKPSELSGGQKQRVAIARALVKSPEIILADEPTGALDSKTGKQVFETLRKLSKEKLVVVVSHDREFAEFYGDRVIELADGKVVSDIKKYKTAAVGANEGVSVVDNKIIHIKKGYKLTENDMRMIAEYISENEDDTIISLDKGANTDFKKLARLDDDGRRDSFKPTAESDLEIKPYGESEFKLIKSRMPIKNMIKIGANSIKVKPIKLIFTIILSAFAFAFFGVADTLASYDKVTATVSSITDNDISYVSFLKNDEDKWIENMDDSDIAFLNEKFDKLHFIPIQKIVDGRAVTISNQNFKTDFVGDTGGFSKNDIIGMVELTPEKLTTLKCTILEGGHFPTDSNEILVTYYQYLLFEKYGWKDYDNASNTADIKKPNDLIGKTLFVSDKSYKIAGVVDTGFDYDHFKQLIDKDESDFKMKNILLIEELSTVLNYSYHSVIFSYEGFINDNPHFIATSKYEFQSDREHDTYYNPYFLSGNLDVEPITTLQYMDITENVEIIAGLQFMDITDAESIVYLNGKTKETLSDNDIIINYRTAVDLFNERHDDSLFISYGDLKTDGVERIRQYGLASLGIEKCSYASDDKITKNFNIAGIDIAGADVLQDDSEYYFGNYIYLSSNNLNYCDFFKKSVPYSMAISEMPTRRSDIKDIVEFSQVNNNGITYSLTNSVTVLLSGVNEMIEMLATIFLYVGVCFAIFAAILMANFIAISISNKKREIGILRAVGARGTDVFGIFFSESCMIAIINFVIATVLTFIAAFSINTFIKGETGFAISMLTVGFRQIVIILATSVLIAFIASVLPIWRIARKKPIDSINNR